MRQRSLVLALAGADAVLVAGVLVWVTGGPRLLALALGGIGLVLVLAIVAAWLAGRRDADRRGR